MYHLSGRTIEHYEIAGLVSHGHQSTLPAGDLALEQDRDHCRIVIVGIVTQDLVVPLDPRRSA